MVSTFQKLNSKVCGKLSKFLRLHMANMSFPSDLAKRSPPHPNLGFVEEEAEGVSMILRLHKCMKDMRLMFDLIIPNLSGPLTLFKTPVFSSYKLFLKIKSLIAKLVSIDKPKITGQKIDFSLQCGERFY